MWRPVFRHAAHAALFCCLLGPASAQPYTTLAGQPDPRDFLSREDGRLMQAGTPVRFMGYDIGWLGVHPDGSAMSAPLTPFEVRDALATVQAMGGTVVRVRPVGGHAGQADEALAALDLVIRSARDMGLKVIVPLAGSGRDCPAFPDEAICAAAAGQHGKSEAFFTDEAVRAAFLAGVANLVDRVNPLTNTAYRDEPAILMWENCLACGADAEPEAVSAWAEQVGQAIKASDHRHLYESGAFAGRIGPSVTRPVPAVEFATGSVDVVGDDLTTGSDPAVARDGLDTAADLVTATGKAYVMDSIGWVPSVWKTVQDLDAWQRNMARQRGLSGAIAGRLVGHAEHGGFLPASPAAPTQGVGPLYFPGIATGQMDAAAMTERGRALRRFAYAMADISQPPAYLLPPMPEIIAAAHAHLTWRGGAGAARYTIERSPDPSAPGSWTVVCDACATDLGGGWQDPAPPKSPAWYRIIPANINGHRSVPSEPVQASR